MRSPRPTRLASAALGCMAVFAIAAGSIAAQQVAGYEPAAGRENPFPLTIQSIMRGPELVGQSPVGVQWTDDGDFLYFRWLPGGEPWHADRKLYRVSAEGGTPEEIPEEEAEALAPLLAGGDVSPDGRRRIASSGGDLYLIDRESGEVRRLTHTADGEGSAVFSGDGRSIFFSRDQNLYRFTLETGEITQLTRIEAGPAPSDDPEPEGLKAFLEAQQEELFEHIRRQKAEEEEREARDERREAAEPKTVHLDRGERAGGMVADPTGAFVAVTAFKNADAQSTDIPLWITEDGYTQNTERRSKVGDVQSSARLGIIRTATGEATWLDLAPETPDGAEAEEGEGEGEGGSDEPALAQASFNGWNDAGTHGLVFAVDYDFKGWRLYALEAETGELRLLDSLDDEAWVGGPCFGCMGWIPDSDRIWYVSEETGYSHVYTVGADGTGKRALTSGEWEVRGVEIPEGWDAFLLHTGEVSAHDLHPWRMDFDGSNRTLLVPGTPGSFQATPAPEGNRMAIVHSRGNRPPEVFLAGAGPSSTADALTQVTASPTGEWLAYDWKDPEIIRFAARDGIEVPARIYRPADFGVEPNGAGVVFVHGAGYLQNVHHSWSSYFREYMFHHFLASQGYTVLDIDYRGSAGYGRDWRTAIYRHMGGWDLSDQVDGAAYLVAEEGVDEDRLGIYGGSYGGFITLMALFTEPGVFEAGGALRSVTDWAHYNHWYTSRILNQPQDDEEAYRQSSPIYFADGLEGHLLIAHGMYDTNVHFSDVVRLAQRLIELGKENWEMAVYPVENHGFSEPTSWTDEYRRIYELFERVIGGGGGALTQGQGG